jgi:hypothetical protein
MSKQPDRFERLVKNSAVFAFDGEDYIPKVNAVTLVRKEHRAIVRLIKKQMAWVPAEWPDGIDFICRNDLLAALDKRRR